MCSMVRHGPARGWDTPHRTRTSLSTSLSTSYIHSNTCIYTRMYYTSTRHVDYTYTLSTAITLCDACAPWLRFTHRNLAASIASRTTSRSICQ